MSLRLLPFRRALLARPPTRQFLAFRSASSTSKDPSPQKEAQLDREKMDTQANEYSKSGTDAASAAQENAAFDPNSSNDPDEARKEAAKGNEANPLDASPANPELSAGTSEVSSGAAKKQSEGGGGRQGGGDASGNKHGGSSV